MKLPEKFTFFHWKDLRYSLKVAKIRILNDEIVRTRRKSNYTFSVNRDISNKLIKLEKEISFLIHDNGIDNQ